MSDLFLLLFLVSLVCLVVGLIRPSSFSKFLKQKATRKNCVLIFALATLVFFVLFGMTTEPSQKDNSQSIVNNKKKEQQQDKSTDITLNQISSINYEIVDTKDLSYKALGNKSPSDYTLSELDNLPNNKKMSYKVLVYSKIKEDQVNDYIQKVILDIIEKDKDIDEMSLMFYSNKEITGGMYDVAMAIWAPDGKLGNVTSEIAKKNDRTNYKTTITVKENLDEYLTKKEKDEYKIELSEEQRREIFKKLIEAEDKARTEADNLFPVDASDPNYKPENLVKNIDKNQNLMNKYKAEVRKKYRITEDTEIKIVSEALEEGWPKK